MPIVIYNPPQAPPNIVNTPNAPAPAQTPAPSTNLNPSVDTWGTTIPMTIGNIRLVGKLIWMLLPSGGKCSFAVSFGYRLDPTRPQAVLNRFWGNGNLMYDGNAVPPTGLAGMVSQFYPGSSTQGIDPTIQADRGTDTPAYRGQQYLVFNQLDTATHFQGQTPFISAELLDNPGGRMLVSDVIRAFARRAGYADADVFVSSVAEFPDLCDGAIIDQDMTFQQFLTSLKEPYDLSIIDAGDQIKIIRRSSLVATAVVELTDDELITENPDDDVITFQLAEVSDIPYKVEVSYLDAVLDYQSGMQYAQLPRVPVLTTVSNNVKQVQVPLVITASEALNIAYGILYRGVSQQMTLAFKCMPKRFAIEPGDVINVTSDGTTYTCRVVTSALGPDYTNDITAEVLLANISFDYTVDYLLRSGGVGGGTSIFNPTQFLDPLTGNDSGGDAGAVEFQPDVT